MKRCRKLDLIDEKYFDCFAMSERGCRILKETVCRKENCTFFKTKEQDRLDRIKYPMVDYAERIKSKEFRSAVKDFMESPADVRGTSLNSMRQLKKIAAGEPDKQHKIQETER